MSRAYGMELARADLDANKTDWVGILSVDEIPLSHHLILTHDTPDTTVACLFDFFEPYRIHVGDIVKGFILASQLWLAHPELLPATLKKLDAEGLPPAGGQIEALLNALTERND